MIGRRGFLASLTAALIAPRLPVERVAIEVPVAPIEIQGYFCIADMLKQGEFVNQIRGATEDFDRMVSRYADANACPGGGQSAVEVAWFFGPTHEVTVPRPPGRSLLPSASGVRSAA